MSTEQPGKRRRSDGHGNPHRNKSRNNKHYGQGGNERNHKRRSNPTRQRFREERMAQHANEPDLPDGLDLEQLPPEVRRDLKVLSRENAEAVGKHILMAVELIDDVPALALSHARAAKNRAGRVAIAREVNGITAYRAGEWKEALSELRAARRIGGGPGHLALMADCERGLGRPEKAIELARSEEARQLGPEEAIEFAIVVAGARHDKGQHESALLTLERARPSQTDRSFHGLRLAYAYADALAQVGRTSEAIEWFTQVQALDEEEMTDAAQRVAEFS